MSRYYIGLLELRYLFRRRFLLLTSAPLLFGLFGVLLAFLWSPAPLYRSVCTLIFEDGLLLFSFPSLTQPNPTLQTLGVGIPPIKSMEVLRDAVEAMGEFPQRLPSQKEFPDPLFISFIEELQSGISVREGQLANTLDIEVIGRDPHRSRKLANAIAVSYINRNSKKLQVRANGGLRPVEKYLEEAKGRLQQVQGILDSLPPQGNDLEVDRLRREADALRETIGILEQVKRDVGIEAPGKFWKIRVLKPATLSEKPINPPKVFSWGGLCALTGFLLALLGALLAGNVSPSLGVLEDVERELGLPVLGVIPRIDSHRRKARHKGIWKEERPSGSERGGFPLPSPLYADSGYWESYRTLRTSVLSGRKGEKKTLLLTSATPREGRTLSAVSLAMVSAQAGRKTLLVDADLREPQMAMRFGLEEIPGLTDVLAGSLPWQDARRTVTDLLLRGMSPEEVMRTPGVDNLHILTSGSVPDNPGLLFESDSMGAFLSEVREAYELVILDGPSSLSWAEAAVLGSRVDAVLLLYRVGMVTRRVLKRASARLNQAGCRLMGLVLNGMRPEYVPAVAEEPNIKRPPDAHVLPIQKERMEREDTPVVDTMGARKEETLPWLKLDNSFRSPRWIHILVGIVFFGAGLLWLGGLWNPIKNEKPDRGLKIPKEQEITVTNSPYPSREAPRRDPVPEVSTPPESGPPPDSSSSPVTSSEKVKVLPHNDPIEVLPEVKLTPVIETSPPPHPYSLYLGSFKTIQLAKRALALYGMEGITPYWSRVYFKEKGLWYRIYIGTFREPEEALSFMETYGLKEAELKKTQYGNLIGEYSRPEEWETLMGDLRKLGYSPYGIPAQDGKTRIIVGAYLTRAGAERQNEDLKADGVDARVIER